MLQVHASQYHLQSKSLVDFTQPNDHAAAIKQIKRSWTFLCDQHHRLDFSNVVPLTVAQQSVLYLLEQNHLAVVQVHLAVQRPLHSQTLLCEIMII